MWSVLILKESVIIFKYISQTNLHINGAWPGYWWIILNLSLSLWRTVWGHVKNKLSLCLKWAYARPNYRLSSPTREPRQPRVWWTGRARSFRPRPPTCGTSTSDRTPSLGDRVSTDTDHWEKKSGMERDVWTSKTRLIFSISGTRKSAGKGFTQLFWYNLSPFSPLPKRATAKTNIRWQKVMLWNYRVRERGHPPLSWVSPIYPCEQFELCVLEKTIAIWTGKTKKMTKRRKNEDIDASRIADATEEPDIGLLGSTKIKLKERRTFILYFRIRWFCTPAV